MPEKKGYKYLIKNIGLLTIGSFSSKLLAFFLVPLYTSVLTTSEYGLYDLIYTTISLLIPVLTQNVNEGIMRFTIEKNNNEEEILKVGIKYTIVGIGSAIILIAINHFFRIVKFVDAFSEYFIIIFILQSFSMLLLMFARGLELVKEIAITGVISTLTMIICNIVFLLYLQLGLKGYFLATIIGIGVQDIYLACKCSVLRLCLKKQRVKKDLEIDILRYSRPLIVNSVSWWINNASDRFIVTFFCGVAANGVYSVAYKIPSILNVMQSIFLQAWTISAVKDYDPNDEDYYFSNLYSTYNFLMVISCSLLIATDKYVARVLYAKDFYDAWKYVPFLLISNTFGAVSGYIGGIFSAVKDSKSNASSTFIGAIANTIFNLSLVPIIGPIGAAIATAIGYFIVWKIRYNKLKLYIDIKIREIRDIVSYVLMVVQAIALIYIKNMIICYFIQVIIICTLFILNLNEIKLIMHKVSSLIKR